GRPLTGGAPDPARGGRAGGRPDGAGPGVAAVARRAADHHPRGPEPPGPPDVRGRGASGPAAGAGADRPPGRPEAGTGAVAAPHPRRGEGAGAGRSPRPGRGRAQGRAVAFPAVPIAVRAIRGATTVDSDDREEVLARTSELVKAMLERNGVDHDDLISAILTATSDIRSAFPAEGARAAGLVDVPLIGAQELDVEGSLPRCIRVMIHVNTDRPRSAI